MHPHTAPVLTAPQRATERPVSNNRFAQRLDRRRDPVNPYGWTEPFEFIMEQPRFPEHIGKKEFSVPKGNFDLTGQVALVTGGGTGIGECIALTLARYGADIAVASRRRENLESTAEKVRAQGRKAWVHPTDIRNTTECRRLIHTVVEECDRIDVLVNNAGGSKSFRFDSWPDSEIDNSIALNFRSVFILSQETAIVMAQQGSGRIINISSIASQTAMPGLGPYGMSKAAVISLTKCMAAEYGSSGVRVNCVCAGFIKSQGLERAMAAIASTADEVARETNALGRAGSVEEVAYPVLFLASDASSYVSGETIYATGGPPLSGPW